jgi:biopolymer transport protein ExbB
MTLMDLFREGGFIMIPLAFYSFLMVAVVIRKVLFLMAFSRQYKTLQQSVKEMAHKKDVKELKWMFRHASTLVSSPHEVILDECYDPEEDKDILKEKLHRKLQETLAGLKSGMWILGTIGSSAPFVGLFGTVVGIMKSFQSIGSSGKGGFAVVAAGISEALIATAAGILVAVLALLFFNYFNVKIAHIYRDFKGRVEDFYDDLVLIRRMKKERKSP